MVGSVELLAVKRRFRKMEGVILDFFSGLDHCLGGLGRNEAGAADGNFLDFPSRAGVPKLIIVISKAKTALVLLLVSKNVSF